MAKIWQFLDPIFHNGIVHIAAISAHYFEDNIVASEEIVSHAAFPAHCFEDNIVASEETVSQTVSSDATILSSKQ